MAMIDVEGYDFPIPHCDNGHPLTQPEGVGLDGVCPKCQPALWERLLIQGGFVDAPAADLSVRPLRSGKYELA